MKNIIACRPGCYGVALPEALGWIKKAGLDHAEVPFASDGDYAGLAKEAEQAGVTISSLAGGVKLDNAESVASLEQAIAGASQIGTRIIFLSAGVEKVPPEDGIDKLRALAEQAHAAGVVLSVETHPPYGLNAETAIRTFEAVGSPGLGHNYDTANIYFYNENVDTVAELKKVLPYLGGVHLKDTNGGYKTWHFGTLGEGVVPFDEVFRVCNEGGFHGPFTMEIEGIKGEELSEDEAVARVTDSVQHLRDIGAV